MMHPGDPTVVPESANEPGHRPCLIDRRTNSMEGSTTETPVEESSMTGTSIDDLPGGPLTIVMEFVGLGQYLFVATVNHAFQRSYMEQFSNTDTFYGAALESLARAKMTWPDDKNSSIEVDPGSRSSKQLEDKWAQSHKCPLNAYICRLAAKGGDLTVLQWIRSQGCRWVSSTCTYAAWGGHLHVLQWARSHGCPWDGWTCSHAALGGHLHVLQWSRSHGCPWDEVTCRLAAYGGHLEVLQWARSHGCPWNELTCKWAARRGHSAMLQWAQSHGCPWDEET